MMIEISTQDEWTNAAASTDGLYLLFKHSTT